VTPEHYTRGTVAASFWCAKCSKVTLHRVDDRRRGPCIPCMERLDQEATDRQRKRGETEPPKQADLFGG
jgi:hypothetical protein